MRYLLKSKIYSFINIAGLALGLACAMVILLFIKDELSFDAFHKNANSIYEVTVDVRFPDGSSMDKFAMTSILLGPYLESNLPEVQSSLRLTKAFWDMKLGDAVQSQAVMLADTNFFTLLTFPLLQGNPKTALQQLHSVVISEDLALRHFGSLDAIGKSVLFEREGEFKSYTVTGVAKSIPQNSSIQFEVVVPLVLTPEELGNDRWVGIDVNTLLLLTNGSNMAAVATKIQQVYEAVSKDAFVPVRAAGFDAMFYHGLVPLESIHLSQEFKTELGFGRGSNPVYSYILSGLALFILVIACINFINLSIARSIKRAKEIGIRKVVGGGRRQLIMQFLGESFLFCSFSFIWALIIAQLALPLFNEMTGKVLSLTYLMDFKLMVGCVLLFFTTALLAGCYPAMVLSGFKPVETLYKQFRLSSGNYFQKGLVVFQFSLASLMVLATLTIYFQFEYLTNKDLGYDSSHLVHVPVRGLSQEAAKLFRDELMRNQNIVLVAPFRHSVNNAKIKGDSIWNFTFESVDENFVDILKLQIVEGRNFSSLFPSDASMSVLVNEAFVKMAGLKDPIGHEIDFFLTNEKKLIVGIVRDYHFASLRDAIGPQCFGAGPGGNEPYGEMLIRIRPASEAVALPYIQQSFRKLFPMQPYTYRFDEDENRSQYTSESNWKLVIFSGALITILISAVGLFGLSILTAERRYREIGIRKVLGATVRSIALALTRDFLWLISLALLIAMPIGYWAGNMWLVNYPYRVSISAWIFVETAALILIIATCTTGYQSVKAALMNPAKSLKSE